MVVAGPFCTMMLGDLGADIIKIEPPEGDIVRMGSEQAPRGVTTGVLNWNRSKRDIKTIVLKIRLDNPKGAFVPGMTAEVLVSPEQLKGSSTQSAAAGQQ